MRIVKFDIDSFNRTSGLAGGATYTVVEEEIAEIEMICDEHGNPTRGGVIGYWLAYAIMAAFVGGMFFFL